MHITYLEDLQHLFAMIFSTTNQTTWTINISIEARPYSTWISIRRFMLNFSIKIYILSYNLMICLFEDHIFSKESISDELIYKYLIFELLLNKIYHFFHYSRKFNDSGI